PRGIVGIAASQPGERTPAGARTGDAAPSGTLIVGQGIEVKGEIDSCRILVVEGQVEAALKAETLEVLKGGVFRGSAEVERAEIAGTVDGTLIVTGELAIAPTGRVCGTIRYGRITIHSGGEIAGDIDAGGALPTQQMAPAVRTEMAS
ncbi:MAG: polymer-forming cytoskeletal protein, partial [Verrucomicrobia bacterium]